MATRKRCLNVTPDDVFVGIAAARVHVRARRPGGVSAALRRHGDAARERLAGEHDRDHRDSTRATDLLHRADRLPGDDGGDGRGRETSRRSASRCRRARRSRRRCSTSGRGGPARRSSTESAPPSCCTSSSAIALATRTSGCTGRTNARDTRRASSTRKMQRAAARVSSGAPRRPRPDGLPLFGRRAADVRTCANGWNLTGDAFSQRRTRADSTSPPAPTT